LQQARPASVPQAFRPSFAMPFRRTTC
jgi:hypothetical protein